MSSTAEAAPLSAWVNPTDWPDDQAVPVDHPTDRIAARAAKRMLDIALATLAIAVLAAPMLLIALAIVIWDPGPVLFRQVRAGRRGQPFRIAKFRTMVVDAEKRLADDPVLLASYLAGDNKLRPAQETRVTRIGRLLRATSLDELPQLFNVLAGSMSLVGPRPVLYSELRYYGTRTGRVLAVRPGITGPWQVSGRSSVGRAERVEMDEAYASWWSIAGDLSILARTIVAVGRRDGAY